MRKIFLVVLFYCLLFVPVQAYDMSQRHDIFTPSFQLLWNDFKSLISTKKINFKGADPSVSKVLNRNNFTVADVNPDSYYKICGPKTINLKAKIQREIFEKFHQTSKVLDNIDWSNISNNQYILYALFKKDVEFPVEFSVLDNMAFNNSKDKYKYFGFTSVDAKKYKKQVKPLFYNYNFDYAVSITTKSGDRIILYRTNSTENVYDLYSKLTKYSNKNYKLGDNDKLFVPFISLDKQIEYKQLYNRKINDSNMVITKAIDDIQFNLDNKGAKLRNESIIEAVEMSLPLAGRGREYDFSKPFVLYMVEKDKSLPYFALRINNVDFLVK